jgi:hypothetical protein
MQNMKKIMVMITMILLIGIVSGNLYAQRGVIYLTSEDPNISGLYATEIQFQRGVTLTDKNLRKIQIKLPVLFSDANHLSSGILQSDANGRLSAITTSAGVAAKISDETGTGRCVMSNSPMLGDPNISGTVYVSTQAYSPKLIGGTTTTSDLYLQTTSGVGTTGADMHLLVGNNGATEAMTILNSGNVGIGTTSPSQELDLIGDLELENTTSDDTGVIYKGADRFIHNFQHPTGNTAIPVGKNTFVGVNAGNFTIGSTATQTYHGSYNSAIGNNSLSSNTIGYYNSAIGYSSLYSNTTGYYNSAIGLSSLYSNTTGNYNSAIGTSSGRYIAGGATGNTTSDYSLYLGSETKALADNGQNEIVIGYDVTGLGSNTVVIGNSSITKTQLMGPYEVNGVLKENLLSNSQFGVWSNSDTNKGLAIIKFDAGTTAAPTAGLALTGGTGAATGKLIRVLTQSGTFAGNNAVGYVLMGATTGKFRDNEVITYTGGQLTVNFPDTIANYAYSAATISFATRTITDSANGFGSFVAGDIIEISGSTSNDRMGAYVTTAAAGSLVIDTTESAFITEALGNTIVIRRTGKGDLIANGDFSVDTDPPAQWVAGTGATLTTEAGGQVGNCMKALADGTGSRYTSQAFTTVIGKLYKAAVYFKDAATGVNGSIKIGTAIDGSQYYASGSITDDAWTAYTVIFEATTVTTYITLTTVTATNYVLFDEVAVYEVVPCATAADALALEMYTKDTTLDLYQINGASRTKNYNSVLSASSAANNQWSYNPKGAYATQWYYRQYAGKTVTRGIWAKTNTASNARFAIYDGVTYTYSSYHTGGNDWEWLEATKTCSALTSQFILNCYNDVTNTQALWNSDELVYGNSIGSGNYAPKPNEVIYLDVPVNSMALNNKTGASGFSDTAYTLLNFEADTDGMLPKNINAFMVYASVNDSGSAATDTYLFLAKVSGTLFTPFGTFGLANDAKYRDNKWCATDVNGDYYYNVEASGSATFDVNTYRYNAVELR